MFVRGASGGHGMAARRGTRAAGRLSVRLSPTGGLSSRAHGRVRGLSSRRGTPMAVEQVKVPRAGESISEVTLNRWLKPDGSYVKVDEPVVELGTDKAT